MSISHPPPPMRAAIRAAVVSHRLVRRLMRVMPAVVVAAVLSCAVSETFVEDIQLVRATRKLDDHVDDDDR